MDDSQIPVTKPGGENLPGPLLDSSIHVRFPLRVKLGMMGLALFVLVTNIDLVIDAHQTLQRNKGKDLVPIYEKRFTKLRQAIKSFEVVGYFSDGASDSQEDVGNFYLTQYTLAPVIVTRETNRRWVVGNFWKTGRVPAAAQRDRLFLWKDFGDGVALFQSKNE
jgi:hypothetical protein